MGLAINNRQEILAYPEDVLDLTLEICKIKRLLNETADPLELKKRLHRRPGTGEHDNGDLPDMSLLLRIIMPVRTELTKIGQSVFALGNADIKKNAIGLLCFGLLKPFRAVTGRQDFVTYMLELFLDDLANIVLVINDQNAFFLLGHINLDTVFNVETIVKEAPELKKLPRGFYYSLSLISRKFLSFRDRVG
jgi:hypothetical protein